MQRPVQLPATRQNVGQAEINSGWTPVTSGTYIFDGLFAAGLDAAPMPSWGPKNAGM